MFLFVDMFFEIELFMRIYEEVYFKILFFENNDEKLKILLDTEGFI